MAEHSSKVFEFGSFCLDPAEQRLMRNGEPLRVPPKTLELLIALVARAGRLVTKEELLAEVWPGTFVEEGNLAVNVMAIRRLINDEDGKSYIETVPKRGYRFIAPVREVPNGHALLLVTDTIEPGHAVMPATAEPVPVAVPAVPLSGQRSWRRAAIASGAVVILIAAGFMAWRAATLARSEQAIRSIAIMPFKPLVPEADQRYLEVGMADALSTRLAGDRHLRVPPMAALRPNEDPFVAGQRLGVDAVLTGSVQRTGDRLRVMVQLSRVADRAEIWAASFDDDFTDIFGVQDTIAGRIAANLLQDMTTKERATLHRRETGNVDAYDLYLKGRERAARRTPAAIAEAIDAYQDAIRLDPKFALAYAGLADAYSTTASGMPPKTRYPLAKAAAQQAVTLDPKLPEAHVALAFVSYKADWNWKLAEDEFRRAIALDPNSVLAYHQYGEFLRKLGAWQDAIANFKRARELDPYSLHLRLDLVTMLWIVGRFEEAQNVIDDGLKQDPKSWEMYEGLAELLNAQKRTSDAVEAELKSRILAGQPLSEVDQMREAFRAGGKPGYLRREIQVLESRLNHPVNEAPWDIATSLSIDYAMLQDREQTMHWLEVATARGEEAPLSLHYPFYDFMRDDPRFQALWQRVAYPR